MAKDSTPVKPDNKLELTVVVSGVPTTVVVNPNQKVEHLVKEALNKAGAANKDPDLYLLTFNDREIALEERIEALGLADGDTLSLAPRQGVGG